MKDNISNFDIKKEIILPKMHGHASITLKNVKTGMVDKIESDNVFQPTALQHFLQQGTSLSTYAPYNSKGTDICKYLLYTGDGSSDTYEYTIYRFLVGGLFLFQNPITEGTEFMPAGNRMVGCGRREYSYNGNVTEMGSFNIEDSEVDLNNGSLRQTWDFSTTQANGTISCVSLTSAMGGALGYGNASGAYINSRSSAEITTAVPLLRNQRNEFIFNNIGYVFDLPDANTFRVRKYKTGNTQLSIFNSKLIDTITFDLNTIGKGNMNFNSERDSLIRYSLRYIGNGIFRFASTYGSPVSIANGEQWYYYEYNILNDNLTLKSFTNETGESLRYDSRQYVFLRGSKIFIHSTTTNNKTFLINLTNNAIIRSFINLDDGDPYSYLDDLQAYGNIGNDENLILLKDYNSSNHPIWRIYDVINNTVYFTNDKIDVVCRQQWDENMWGYYGSASGMYTNTVEKFIKEPRYLATINNLSTPIEKTNAHTMKVTYTLEEV